MSTTTELPIGHPDELPRLRAERETVAQELHARLADWDRLDAVADASSFLKREPVARRIQELRLRAQTLGALIGRAEAVENVVGKLTEERSRAESHRNELFQELAQSIPTLEQLVELSVAGRECTELDNVICAATGQAPMAFDVMRAAWQREVDRHNAALQMIDRVRLRKPELPERAWRADVGRLRQLIG
jgi:hypothetical protein